MLQSELDRRRRHRTRVAALVTAMVLLAGVSSRAVQAPSLQVTGRVVTADTGQPVRMARVLVRVLPGAAGAQAGSAVAMTDASGDFSLNGLPAGQVIATVSKAGFVTRNAAAQGLAGARSISAP